MRREREITAAMCDWFLEDTKALMLEVDRMLSRHREFERTEWLGGSQEANNVEVAPEACKQAMRLLRMASSLVSEADHLVALCRSHAAEGGGSDA